MRLGTPELLFEIIRYEVLLAGNLKPAPHQDQRALITPLGREIGELESLRGRG